MIFLYTDIQNILMHSNLY